LEEVILDVSKADLSKGWSRLNRELRQSYEHKVSEAIRAIEFALAEQCNPLICWSGGKDSTVVLHLVKKCQPDIKVLFVDCGVLFPETPVYVERTADRWHLNLSIRRPGPGKSFWETGNQFGWPIFGKSFSRSVESSRRSKRLRSSMSKLEKAVAVADIPISPRCAQHLQIEPTRKFEKENQVDSKFVGLRASESRTRARVWIENGNSYFVNRYFGRNQGIWKINPIATWTEEDIWRYTALNQISACELYSMGHSRNGCWTCAMALRNGQLLRLMDSHPGLFRKLIFESPMANPIAESLRLLSELGRKSGCSLSPVRRLLGIIDSGNEKSIALH
jgi:3'-phosphoadenosine 5'-phosphosulfate sulfotransferase (PAPS reductase)/FAD synthetase